MGRRSAEWSLSDASMVGADYVRPHHIAADLERCDPTRGLAPPIGAFKGSVTSGAAAGSNRNCAFQTSRTAARTAAIAGIVGTRRLIADRERDGGAKMRQAPRPEPRARLAAIWPRATIVTPSPSATKLRTVRSWFTRSVAANSTPCSRQMCSIARSRKHFRRHEDPRLDSSTSNRASRALPPMQPAPRGKLEDRELMVRDALARAFAFKESDADRAVFDP